MVTIRDVARESGVSVTTVSHVLNGTRHVEPETAQRVRRAIERLDYYPLRKYDHYGMRGARNVGFFACSAGGNACADLFERLFDRLAARNVCLQLIMVSQTITDGKLRALQKFYRLDDCVVHHSVQVTDKEKSAEPYAVPTTFISATASEAGGARIIAFDYRQAVRLALTHLLSRSHQEIAILSGMHNSEMNDLIRSAAREIYIERGQAYRESYFLQVNGCFEETISRREVEMLFARLPEVSAVITIGTWTKAFAIDYFRRRELECPRDFSLITMGGLYTLEASQPEITRVNLSVPRLAEALTKALLEERGKGGRMVLAPEFVPGASTRTLARNPSGLEAARPETLELSEEEMARVRREGFKACISLDDAGAMFSKLMLQGLQESLSGLNMTLLSITVASGDIAARDQQLRNLSGLNPDVIISFSNDQTALRDRFVAISGTRAKLVLGVDVPQGLPDRVYTTCVATNEAEKGRLSARLLASEMCRRGKRRIGFFCNADLNFCARQRDLSAISTITEDFPQLEVAFRRDFIREQNALSTVADALSAHPETEGLYIYSANTALLVQNYLLAIGREDILIVTTQINDAIARMFSEHPNLLGIISSQPYEMGRYLGLAAAGSLIGKALPRYIAVEPVVITRDNIEKSWVRTAKRKAPIL